VCLIYFNNILFFLKNIHKKKITYHFLCYYCTCYFWYSTFQIDGFHLLQTQLYWKPTSTVHRPQCNKKYIYVFNTPKMFLRKEKFKRLHGRLEISAKIESACLTDDWLQTDRWRAKIIIVRDLKFLWYLVTQRWNLTGQLGIL